MKGCMSGTRGAGYSYAVRLEGEPMSSLCKSMSTTLRNLRSLQKGFSGRDYVTDSLGR